MRFKVYFCGLNTARLGLPSPGQIPSCLELLRHHLHFPVSLPKAPSAFSCASPLPCLILSLTMKLRIRPYHPSGLSIIFRVPGQVSHSILSGSSLLSSSCCPLPLLVPSTLLSFELLQIPRFGLLSPVHMSSQGEQQASTGHYPRTDPFPCLPSQSPSSAMPAPVCLTKCSACLPL